MTLLAASANGSPLPTLRTITVDGQFSDWNQILLNPLQVTVDGNASIVNSPGCYPTNPDRDCPSINGTGRDILTFAWTYDPTSIYTYLRRDASSSAVMNYFFIMDLDADGVAEASDRVAQVRWSGGGNLISYLRIYAYVPANPGGDPMACTSAGACPSPGSVGYVDGYSMPGSLGATILYDSTGQNGGAVAGDRFEVAMPWSALGVPAGTPIFWHVAASPNASFNPAIDNSGGPDGKLGSFGVFAVDFYPDRTGATASPGTLDYCHTVENTGQFADAYNLTAVSSSGAGVAIYAADAACTRGALLAVDADGDGDFSGGSDTAPSATHDTNSDGIPDTGTLAGGATWKVILQLRVAAGNTNSSDRLIATAQSTRRADVSATVVDRTAIGGVTVAPNLTASGTVGLAVLIGPHTVQNNLAGPDDFELRVGSASGWSVALYADAAGAPGALLATDSNGDGTWDGAAPTTGTLGAGSQRQYWLRATIAAGATVGSTHLVSLRATSRTNPSTWGEAFDVITVSPALQLLPSYSAASNTALVGAPGGLVYLPHRLINSRAVAETVTLSQTAPAVAGYTIRWFTDPDGDGNFSDGTLITGPLTVPPFGGVVHLVTEISVPASGTPAAFPAVTTATGTGSSASAQDNVTVGQLSTFRDPLYTQSTRHFAACSTVYVQVEGLSANQTSTYQLQYVNPLGVVTAAQNLPTDSTGTGRVSLALGASDAPGDWTLRVRQGATLLSELTPVVVERQGAVLVLAPSTAQDGELLAVAAQLTNSATQSTYSGTRVDFELRDPLGNLFRSSTFSPLEVAYQDSEVASTAWADVTFPSYGSYTLTVTWTTACGSVIATGAATIVAAPEAPELTLPPHNSVVTTATPALQGTARSGAPVSVYVDGVLVGTSVGPSFSVTPSALSQGAHSWYATQSVSGVSSPASVSFSFTVDSVAPETSISAGPAQGSVTALTTATFQFTSNDPSASFRCSLDGAVFSPCTSPAAYASLAEGAHTFAVRASDPSGNTDPTPATRAWTVDLTPPDTAVTGPGSPSPSASASFSFSSADGVSFQCSLDGASYAACTSPVLRSGLTEGSHTFAVRAVDAAGNVDPTPAQHNWLIDLTAPDTVIDSGPPASTNLTTAQLAFSSAEGVAFECSLDGAVFAACSAPVSFSGLGEGSHTFLVRALDAAGNVDPSPASHTWNIDLTAPQTAIDSGPASPTRLTGATLAFSSPDGVSFECSLDGATFGGCTSPVTLGGLADGPHTFAVRATDAVGNVDATPASHAWTVDTLPPDTAVTGPPSPHNSAGATLSFSATGGGVGFECSLDGALFAACTSPRTLSGLGEGSHTFLVRALDAAGNVDPSPAGHTWVVDLTPPDTTLTGPSGLTPLDSAQFTFSAQEPATFECSLDGAAATPCTSPVDVTSLDDGPHSFTVVATDVAGNVEPAPATLAWTVDTTPPETTLTSFPPAVDSSTSPSFGFTSSEAGSSYECSLDGAAFSGCASPKTYSVLDGPHTFAVRAIDPATNMDLSPAQYAWTVDSSIPDTQLDSAPPAFSAASAASFAFSSTSSGASFQCSLDGAAYSTCTSPVDAVALLDGVHTFAVFAISAAGTPDPDPATHSWTVDTVAPVTSVSGPASPAGSATATFSLSANEVPVAFACSLDGAAFTGCTSPWTLNGLSEGPHQLEVFATDQAGNADLTPAPHAWVVDLTPPETVVTGPASPTASTDADFSFSSPDDAAAQFECSLDGAAFAACGAPVTVGGLAEGDHTFQVRSYDPAGNRDPTPATHLWTVDLTPPDTLLAGPASPSGSASATFTFSSPDDAGATFECRLDAEPFGACTSPVTRTGLLEGSHTFQVRAVDAVDNADPTPAAHTWTVDLTAPDTTLSGPASPSAVTTATFAFAGDSAQDTLECSLDGVAFTACASPLTVSGLGEGPHTFRVQATDLAGNTDPTPAEHAWLVDLSAPQTFVAGPASPTAQTTAAFTFTSDDGGASFRCALDTEAFAPCLPDESRSGLAEGSHTLRVVAVDAAGNVDPSPAEHSWIVDLTPPDTTLDGPAPLTNDPDAVLTFTAGEDVTFTCSLNGAVPAQCSSPHSYPALSDGVYVVEVLATDTAGNEELAAATHGWTVDTTPPDTAFTAQPPAVDSDSTPAFSFSSPDGDVTGFECSLDGAVFSGCASAAPLPTLGDGPHTFQVRAVDAATNRDASPATHTWTVDTSVPDTALSQAPAPFSSSTGASFAFTSTASPASFECSVEGGAFVTCGDTLTLSGLVDGPHRLDVRSTNQAGNTDPSPAFHQWTVDTVPPETSLQGPLARVRATTASFTFDASETGVGFECSLDAAAWSACTSPLSLTSVSEGEHTLAVRATDPAGNLELSAAQHAWTVDLTAPDTGITGPGAHTASTAATLAFTSTEGDASFECSVDGAAYEPCGATLGLADLSEGEHTVSVRAIDAVGNSDASPATHSWIADVTAPETTVDSGPAALVNTSAAELVFGSDDPDAVFECDVDGAGFSACGATLSLTGLADGAHSVQVRTRDLAGNEDGTPASHAWTSDTLAPDTTFSLTPPAQDQERDATFEFASTEAGATLMCSLDGAAYSPCTSPLQLDHLPEGPHTLEVYAVDPAGNPDGTPAHFEWDIRVDLRFVGGGCGCGSSQGSAFAFLGAFVLIGLLRRRRRA